jgi:hypothetical protein
MHYDYLTNTLANQSDFSVAYWRSLEDSSIITSVFNPENCLLLNVYALTTTQRVGTTGIPLFTTGTQLVTTGTPLVIPLVSLASTGLPWAAHWYYWNTLGNTPGELIIMLMKYWLPLEYP